MCRVFGYIGPPLRLCALIEDAPHSLLFQSYAAKELETSVVSADGWGAAWYLEPPGLPCVYRSTLPIWGDPNRQDLGRALESHCVLGAVRSATDPLSIAAANTQPFKFDKLCFLHNGFLENFAARWMRPLRETLSEHVYSSLSGTTDSEHVFGLIVDEWLARAGSDPDQRLESATRAALARLADLGEKLAARALLSNALCAGRARGWRRLLCVRAPRPRTQLAGDFARSLLACAAWRFPARE
jgi:glutamine amidotransferase